MSISTPGRQPACSRLALLQLGLLAGVSAGSMFSRPVMADEPPALRAGVAAPRGSAALVPVEPEALGFDDPPATGTVPTTRVGPAPLPDQAGLSLVVTRLLREHLPTQYENLKDWGHTKRTWDGLHLSLDGARIKTKRRWKEANHGTWKMYRAWLIDPQQHLQVQLGEFREISPGRVSVDVTCTAKLGAFTRLAEWQHGVQLLSISADAESKIRLWVRAELGTHFDWQQFPPALVLDAKAEAADVRLEDFRLIRVSDLHGPVIRELGDALRGVLQKELDERRPKLVAQINRQIERQQEHLRLGWSASGPQSTAR